MKVKKISILISVVLCLFLCSFRDLEQENENINLHTEQNAAVLYESEDDTSTLSESEFSKIPSGALSEGAEGELTEIYESFISALPEGMPYRAEDISGFLGIGEALSWLSGALTSSENMRALALFVAIGLLFSLAEIFISELGDAAAAARSAIAVILSLPVFNLCQELIFEVSEGISRSSELFSGIIPALTALLAVGSGGAAASASGAAMSASLGFVSGVLSESLLPLSAMMFSISMVSAFDTGGITDAAAKGIRGIFNFLIGLISLLIVGILGVQTVISVSADNLAMKSAKYAVSGMIPVVGSTVSGALSALISGVKLLSGTMGAVSVIALLSVVCVPLIRLLFFRFCLFLCITVCSFSGGSFGARFFTSVRGALDTLIAVFASSSLVYLLEIIIVTGSIRGIL